MLTSANFSLGVVKKNIQDDSAMCKQYSYQISALYLIPFLRKWGGGGGVGIRPLPDLRSPKKPSPNRVKKETLAQVFSCEFCEIFKNTLSYRTPPETASAKTKPIQNYP